MRSCAHKVLLLVLIYVFGIGMATLADSQAPRNLRCFFFSRFRLRHERLNSTPCQIVCLLSSETWQNFSAGQFYKTSLTPCPETNCNNSPRETGCSWEKLESPWTIFGDLTPTFQGANCTALAGGGKTPGCFTEGCRLLSTVGTVGWIGPGVGWIGSLGDRPAGSAYDGTPLQERLRRTTFYDLGGGDEMPDFFWGMTTSA